ncbi:DUF4190 domain-containing protein [Actinopolymorpha pittospori]|uniref:DUF4190 domain-containing protein n=1 Tax=Actinopolymorpha pittospori TaxID=648752 RepID=A0A927MYM3_9ACTN|nr:DUF4190 domain-containing protein [Actinopolymorpha pittospori]MBE1607688.1 hypothetical protein [Actinopolymorpha pittospori]
MSSAEKPAGDRHHDDQPVTTRPSGTGGPIGPDESGDPRLAPIPPEGTDAPPDSERVFGRPEASSPYARIVAATTPDPSRGGSHPPAPPPGGGPDPREVTEDQLRRARNRGRFALLLGIAGLATSIFAFPLGLILGVAAIVLGALARRDGKRGRQQIAGATPGMVLGIVASVFACVLGVMAAVFWTEIIDYQDCYSGANTQTAREGCQRHLEEQIMDRVAPAPPPR